MAKKKRKASRTTKSRASPKKRKSHKKSTPEIMIQISQPKMLRKDILESLRESIIFLQGYETIRKLQQEKVALFLQVKNNVKELHDLVEHKLKKYLPAGKLVAHKPKKEQKEEPVITVQTLGAPVIPIQQPTPDQTKVVQTGLDDLEQQLQDIENQLNKV